MRSIRLLRSSLALVGALAVAIALPAGPVAGGTGIRYVDDDGHAGPNQGCDGSHAAATTISQAVDAANPGDTILVCPGTYLEQVSVATPGVTIAAVTPWKAIVKPPVVNTASAPRISPAGFYVGVIGVTANDVTVTGMKVVVPATGDCNYLRTGIYVGYAHHAMVSNNLVTGGQGDPTTCGVTDGIVFDNSTGKITGNLVRRFRTTGVYSYSSSASVTDNEIQLFGGPTCATAGTCSATRGSTTPSGVAQQVAIRSTFGQVRIKRNLIYVPDPVVSTPDPTAGILVLKADTGIGARVAQNRVAGASLGIYLSDVSVGFVRLNVVRHSLNDGMTLNNVDGLEVAGNRVGLSAGRGIVVDAESTGNNIHENDFSGNDGLDCQDLTGDTAPTAAVDPIDNSWTNNWGDDDYPDGICTPKP